MDINIPQEVRIVLDRLNKSGYEAYIVGGCVRDSVMNRVPYDYDVTTNALPMQVAEALSDFKVIETGLKHGTLTIVVNSQHIEVTTFRIDGEYEDNRHPKEVKFSTSLSDDVSRRDFTINAMAYCEKDGFVDLHNGIEDIENKVIRCVGNPIKRFNEDALRIMRAIRFSSQLGFKIEEETKKAIFSEKELLKNISVERFSVELEKLLLGKNVSDVLIEYAEVLEVIIPEISPCVGFNQKNKYHKYTVWEHIVHAIAESKEDRLIRFTMLFHDIAKPECFSIDEKGQGHFHNHEYLSAEKSKEILKRLRFDNNTINIVYDLVKYHYIKYDSERSVRRLLSQIGIEKFRMLIEVQKADNMAKNEFCKDRIKNYRAILTLAEDINASMECMQISQLKINGNDLIKLGYKGKEIGKVLKTVLSKVIDGELPNKKEALINDIISKRK